MVKQKGAIYLLKDRFQIYIPGMASILECPFPPDIVREMDLINHEKLGSLIRQFILGSKIPPGNMVIVLSASVLFIKDFTQPTEAPPQPGQASKSLSAFVSLEELEKKANEFSSLVPFEEVMGKTILLKNGYRVYAANKELLNALQRAFEANNFEIFAIIPATVFGQEVNNKPAMDSIAASNILHKADSLIRDYNLLNQPTINFELEKESDIEMSEDTLLTVKPKNKLPLLLGVFGVLTIVLGIVAWTQLKPQPARSSLKNLSPTSQPQATITSTLNTVPSKTPVVNTEAITAQIINTTETTAKAIELKDYLEKLGIKNVSITTQQNIAAPSTTITFSKNAGANLRTLIVSEVQKKALSTNILEKSNATTDITILLVN